MGANSGSGCVVDRRPARPASVTGPPIEHLSHSRHPSSCAPRRPGHQAASGPLKVQLHRGSRRQPVPENQTTLLGLLSEAGADWTWRCCSVSSSRCRRCVCDSGTDLSQLLDVSFQLLADRRIFFRLVIAELWHESFKFDCLHCLCVLPSSALYSIHMTIGGVNKDCVKLC